MTVVTITTGYENKIAGSLTENSNIARSTGFVSALTASPLPHEAWPSEFTQLQYDNLITEKETQFYNFDGNTAYVLYSFDIIKAIEANYGLTLWRGKTSLADKVTLAKEIITTLSCRTDGKTGASSTRYLHLSAFNGIAYNSPVSVYADVRKTLIKSVPNTFIDDNGYVHFLFYNDPSAGLLMIYYASLDVTLDDAPPTPKPAPPTDLTATAEIGAIHLNWTGATGATGYNIYRSDTSEIGYELIGTTGEMVFVDDISATDNTTYYYVVTAVNEVGTSEYSNEVTVQAIPEPIPEPEPEPQEYTEQNIFVPREYWIGDDINQRAREILVKEYNAGSKQTITSQYPNVCIRTYK